MDDFIAIFIINGIFSLFVALAGNDKRIGGLGAFVISLIFSAIIGLIVVFLSKSNEDIKREEEILNTQKESLKEQREANKIKKKNSFVEDLALLTNLKEKGVLNDEEFEKAKQKIINDESNPEISCNSRKEINKDNSIKKDEQVLNDIVFTKPALTKKLFVRP